MAIKVASEQNSRIAGDDLSREDRLLINCARLNLSQARREAVKEILAGELDWDLLLEKAAWYRLSCLVAYHIRTADLSTFVPQQVLKKLQRLSFAYLARNMLLQDELSHLLAAFNKEGIPIVVLKGAALLGSVYQNISLRPIGDLDILVKPEHLDRAQTIAFCQGFECFHSRHSQEIARKKVHQLPYFFHPKKGIALDIHQHIVDLDSPHHFSLDGFWTRAQHLRTYGADALFLAPEDLLIHLGIHFLFDRRYHSRNAIGQLCDISEVILHYGDSLNWDHIKEFAEENGIAEGLHCVFYTCEQLLGTQVPANVLDQLRPLDLDSSILALFIYRRVLSTEPWLNLNWVSPRLRYSCLRALLSIINKIFHIPIRIFQEQGFRKRKISHYLKFTENIVPILSRLLLRPTELRQDLLLDRWFHDDIYRSTTGTRPDKRS